MAEPRNHLILDLPPSMCPHPELGCGHIDGGRSLNVGVSLTAGECLEQEVSVQEDTGQYVSTYGRFILVRNRFSPSAKDWTSRGPKTSGPPVRRPTSRKSAIRSRVASRSLMLSGVYSVPRGSSAWAPFRITRSARGTSAVMTRSPSSTNSTIRSSAWSGPSGATTHVNNSDSGSLINRFATKVTGIDRRDDARSRMSRVAWGKASASTKIVIL